MSSVKNKEFSTIDAFREFEESHPEKGLLFNDMKTGKLYDIAPRDFLELDWIILSFGDYRPDPLYLKWSERTQEIFMGSVNDGGHVPRFRLMRIDRNDIYESSESLLAWADNRSYNMWCGTASRAERS